MTKGITLLEVLLTIAIMSGVAAVGVVSLTTIRRMYQLWTAEDSVRSLAKTAREWSVVEYEGRSYSLSLSSNVFRVVDDLGQERERYVLPSNMETNPSSLSWSFARVTGKVDGCPCSVNLMN